MTGGLDYSLAFLTGVLGSGHCIGICGGLTSACFMRLQAKSAGPYAAYHGARILRFDDLKPDLIAALDAAGRAKP